MVVPNLPENLCSLVEYLGGLTERASMTELERLLKETDVTAKCLKRFATFGDPSYRRNLICENEWFELLCICWKSGQRSPIHNHAQSTCGLKIIQGVCTETVFQSTDCGQIKAVSSTDMTPGHVCVSQDADVHQVSNLQAAGSDLMTLHIYSPPLREMDMFSLMGDQNTYVPQNTDTICHVGDYI